MPLKSPTEKRPLTPAVLLTCFWYPVARLVVLLPFRVQLLMGRGLGRLAYMLLKKQRHVAAVNLSLCFPEWTAEKRESVTKAHFRSVGMGVFETAFAFWATEARLRKRAIIDGIEHLEAAHARGKGVILLNSHFTSLELSATLSTLLGPPTCGLYRPLRENWLANDIIQRGRSRFPIALFEKSNVRGALKALSDGHVLWYASDQLARPGKRSVLSRLFGEPALTNIGVSNLVRISGAQVIAYQPIRIAKGKYRLRFLPPLENFPTGSDETDAATLNALVEQHINQAPEQYLWIRPRFKDRPPPLPDPYL